MCSAPSVEDPIFLGRFSSVGLEELSVFFLSSCLVITSAITLSVGCRQLDAESARLHYFEINEQEWRLGGGGEAIAFYPLCCLHRAKCSEVLLCGLSPVLDDGRIDEE